MVVELTRLYAGALERFSGTIGEQEICDSSFGCQHNAVYFLRFCWYRGSIVAPQGVSATFVTSRELNPALHEQRPPHDLGTGRSTSLRLWKRWTCECDSVCINCTGGLNRAHQKLLGGMLKE